MSNVDSRRSAELVAAGRTCQRHADYEGALSAARGAVAADSQSRSARCLLIETLIQAGRGNEGLKELRALEAEAETKPLLLQYVGQLYTHLNRHAEAARCNRRAVSLAPDNPAYLYNFATALIAVGELEEAEAALDRVIEHVPTDYDAYYNRATLRRQTPERNHVAALQGALARAGAKGEVALNYALAKELEDLGEHARAFRHLKQGADARRRMLSYAVADDVDTMKAIARAFSPIYFTTASAGHGDDRPVFIVGLPRSGTTLIDRILSSHPAVESLGEISNLAVSVVHLAGVPGPGKRELVQLSTAITPSWLGRAYCDSIDPMAGDAARLIDKTPVNFLYLGLIATALPRARIIHVRRDAMDVCYAMYKTLFRMAYPFSYDLHDLGRYYLAYHELMEHWRKVLKGRFLEIAYEDLVMNQEAVSRLLVAYCGLKWDARCLAFERNAKPSLTASAAQVRQPLYRSSIGLWRRYEDGLAPLADALRHGGIAVE